MQYWLRRACCGEAGPAPEPLAGPLEEVADCVPLLCPETSNTTDMITMQPVMSFAFINCSALEISLFEFADKTKGRDVSPRPMPHHERVHTCLATAVPNIKWLILEDVILRSGGSLLTKRHRSSRYFGIAGD